MFFYYLTYLLKLPELSVTLNRLYSVLLVNFFALKSGFFEITNSASSNCTYHCFVRKKFYCILDC